MPDLFPLYQGPSGGRSHATQSACVSPNERTTYRTVGDPRESSPPYDPLKGVMGLVWIVMVADRLLTMIFAMHLLRQLSSSRAGVALGHSEQRHTAGGSQSRTIIQS